MNYGQAIAALQTGRSIANSEWERQGMSLLMQEPTGMVTEPFIVQRRANGICQVYSPTQADILGTNWTDAGEGKMPAVQAITQTSAQHQQEHQQEHAGARS